MRKAKIISVRQDSTLHLPFIDRWVAFFDNGESETYDGEIPPVSVSKFCCAAKYIYMDIDGDSRQEWYTMTARN